MAVYGRSARERFATAGWLPDRDVLRTVVRVDDRRIYGNRLVRGAAARRVAADLVARVAAQGRDSSRMEVGGDPIYAVTADPDDADVLFTLALGQLADALSGDCASSERLRLWQHARYLLYQAPRTKKGSDAVTRVFLVAVGAELFACPPVIDHDADLRCMVLGQPAAIAMPSDPIVR